MRILLVDDDIEMKAVVEAGLAPQNLTHVTCLESARKHLQSNTPDLILLDVRLPDGSGFDFFKSIKGVHEHLASVPVIFLTGLSGDKDQTRGFELGALDYIVKPFTPIALRARVEARMNHHADSIVELNTKTIKLDLGKMCGYIKGVKGKWKPIRLTKIELQILFLLMKSKDALVTRKELIRHLWSHSGVNVSESVLATHISHLRVKLEEQGRRVAAVYGEGYKLKA